VITKNQIKFIKGLSLKKNRIASQCFVVEGEKNVAELITSDFEIIQLYATTQSAIKTKDTIVNQITNNNLERISTLKSPNKVLAIVKIPEEKQLKNTGMTLVLDNINDPGNLGTIIRLCDWFGVQKIICSATTVDVYNPKVVQASMGSLFRINISYTDLANYLQKVGTPIYGAFMNGEDIKKSVLPKNVHLILGNEANGISDEISALITNRVGVKNVGLQAESLNVAVATAIFLHEFCA
jgi:TrmH family RNA methyltransferase